MLKDLWGTHLGKHFSFPFFQTLLYSKLFPLPLMSAGYTQSLQWCNVCMCKLLWSAYSSFSVAHSLSLFFCSGIGSLQAVVLSGISALAWVLCRVQFLQECFLCYEVLPILTMVFPLLFFTSFCSLLPFLNVSTEVLPALLIGSALLLSRLELAVAGAG